MTDHVKTSLGIWAFGPMITRFVPVGYQPEHAADSTVDKVRRAVEGLGDLIDGYEFHYPQELSEANLDEVRAALDGHDVYCVATGLHLDPRFGRGGLRRLDRRALHHLAGDRGLQLSVPDAVRRELGMARGGDRTRSGALPGA